MSLLTDLKQGRVSAMKEKDAIKRSILTTLLGELEGKAKREGIEISDEMIVAFCKKFIQTNKETMDVSNGNKTIIERLSVENTILDTFLPQQLTKEQIVDIITNGSFDNIGVAMRYFKENYTGQYDGKLVSSLAKELL